MAPPAISLIGDLLRHTISPLIGRLMWPGMLKLMFGPACRPTSRAFPYGWRCGPRSCAQARKKPPALIPSVMALQRRYAELAAPPDARRVFQAIEMAAR